MSSPHELLKLPEPPSRNFGIPVYSKNILAYTHFVRRNSDRQMLTPTLEMGHIWFIEILMSFSQPDELCSIHKWKNNGQTIKNSSQVLEQSRAWNLIQTRYK